MYNKELGCGVLCDYDLSISRRKSRVPGTDRTGTVPFMAVDLLTHKYWNGDIVRLYRHEFEAFLWILPFVFLRYQNGEPQRKTPVEGWMTSNYITCTQQKTHFCSGSALDENRELCQLDFRDHWMLAEELLVWWDVRLKVNRGSRNRRSGTSNEVEDTVPSLWPLFIDRLRFVAKEGPLSLTYIDTLIEELQLEKQFWV